MPKKTDISSSKFNKQGQGQDVTLTPGKRLKQTDMPTFQLLNIFLLVTFFFFFFFAESHITADIEGVQIVHEISRIFSESSIKNEDKIGR